MKANSAGRYDEAAPTYGNVHDVALHVTLLGLTAVAFVVAVRNVLSATGAAMAAYAAGCGLVLLLLCKPLNYGLRVLHSSVDLSAFPARPHERWIFVNGICAGTRWLQENLDMIATVFGRPVVGVHNRTYGIVLDLVECLVQRDFGYMTADIRIAHNAIKTTLLDPDVHRVVLLAHSQGGIIISAALDALSYSDLPVEAWDKLEVYTFGCAANHFSNPPRCVCRRRADSPIPMQLPRYPRTLRQIAVIEHYANELDFVAKMGVLNFTGNPATNPAPAPTATAATPIPVIPATPAAATATATTPLIGSGGSGTGSTGSFVGKVFMRMGTGGHLFCQHYLGPMFSGLRPEFLDETVVTTDGSAAMVGTAGDVHDVERLLADAVGVSQGALPVAQRTVRDVSRLWKYKNGNVPQ